MFQTKQTIYFLWGYDPGNMSVSFIAELSPVYCCLVLPYFVFNQFWRFTCAQFATSTSPSSTNASARPVDMRSPLIANTIITIITITIKRLTLATFQVRGYWWFFQSVRPFSPILIITLLLLLTSRWTPAGSPTDMKSGSGNQVNPGWRLLSHGRQHLAWPDQEHGWQHPVSTSGLKPDLTKNIKQAGKWSMLFFHHQHLKDCDMGLPRTPGGGLGLRGFIFSDVLSNRVLNDMYFRMYHQTGFQRRYILILLETPWLCCDTYCKINNEQITSFC